MLPPNPQAPQSSLLSQILEQTSSKMTSQIAVLPTTTLMDLAKMKNPSKKTVKRVKKEEQKEKKEEAPEESKSVGKFVNGKFVSSIETP